MHSEERDGAILLVSAAEKLNESLLKLLSREHWGSVTLKTEAHQARELLKARHFEYVLVCASDPGEPAALLARDTVQHTGAGVLVLTPAQSYETLSAMLAPLGVLVLARPLSSQLLLQAAVLRAWRSGQPLWKKRWRRCASSTAPNTCLSNNCK